ncbi:5'/3'-nucleotidase SurE [Caldisericum exile]|uniref:5'-nucleotidase SurE n=1 Tax=Caldisericum exile (strain DSM 21853 / NBRC 104410 / AZM16c01) TaxID=511051 RepID=A0A7U6JG95_CALEA|nr:5'/3'-nucleotidase SurE [Caldisericum exile]BAL81185.1 5'-nucleotidase SurE [Caldisericum exile AZM16c01]
MNILITNDDGIESEGLKVLARNLIKLGNIYVVAPQKPQSAGSHATTLHKPLRAEKYPLHIGEKLSLRVSGTPADCVLLAIDVFINEPIDIVVSGINKGPNLGDDIIYSGTVAGAREGAINKILSFAISVNDFENPNFELAANVSTKIIDKLSKIVGSKTTYFNINFPNTNRITGIKFAKLSRRRYKNRVFIGKDPFQKEFYWIGGVLEDPYEEGTDSKYVKEGYATITPLLIDQTDYTMLEALSKVNLEI